MADIRFDRVEIKDWRKLIIRATINERGARDTSYDLWFEFSEPIFVSNESIGVAMSTLCGRSYDNIFFDLPMDPETVLEIAHFTSASVSSSEVQCKIPGKRSGHLLSFSGGFDSLAAKALMPVDTKLVSMDFGGRFARESRFFNTFDTLTVTTNVVDTPLRYNSWSFMGIGAILASDHFRAEYHTFGSILEAGADNLRLAPEAAKNNTFAPFAAAGYLNAPFVLGLTEVGTLVVLARHYPQILGDSLESLATAGEEKRYRKQVLTELVSNRLGLQIDYPKVAKRSTPHFSFGTNFALDFLSLYVIKHGSPELAAELVSGIPSEVVDRANELEMSFYENANPTLYQNFPRSQFGGLAGRLAESGISFYTERDWSDFAAVRALLSKYHQIVLA
ncbi:hypothetical protein IV500_07115 [Paeniglutamicibacter antarcticus]|uniref:Uncharacterized protein n=1 Tax=Arthrobacter terrae TaxID=2935737 RepID=A0A931CSW3_9MICC|nr:hypothetical protein [Arthrobacter terrae]MBG0739163.1 hypothetical protein [Arthrobacter terrae]